MKDYDVLASAGITASHSEIVVATPLREIFIAFDSDYYENFHVARAFARLMNMIIASTKTRLQNRIKVLTWNSARDKNNVEKYLKMESGCVFELA